MVYQALFPHPLREVSQARVLIPELRQFRLREGRGFAQARTAVGPKLKFSQSQASTLNQLTLLATQPKSGHYLGPLHERAKIQGRNP